MCIRDSSYSEHSDKTREDYFHILLKPLKFSTFYKKEIKKTFEYYAVKRKESKSFNGHSSHLRGNIYKTRIFKLNFIKGSEKHYFIGKQVYSLSKKTRTNTKF